MLVVLTSVSGSPGVSTTALGLALTSESDRNLHVEADPVGSSFVHSGYLKGLQRHEKSIVNLVEPNRHGHLSRELGKQVIPINDDVWSLPGLWKSAQADSMQTTGTWSTLGATLAAVPANVVVDAGRLGHRSGPLDLIHHADLVIIVAKPTITSVGALAGTLPDFRRHLHTTRARPALALMLIGSKPYSAHAVERTLGADVITTIPESPHAAIFSEGATLTKFARTRSMYLRALRRTWPHVTDYIDEHRPEWVVTKPSTTTVDLPEMQSIGGRSA